MNRVLLGTLSSLLIFSFESHSQEGKYELESIELIRESLRHHAIRSINDSNARTVLSILKLDLERHGAEFIGLDSIRDSEALAKLAVLDIERIEKEAITPILNDLCLKIESGSSDPVELAAMYMIASDAQDHAIDSTYKNFLASLSDEGVMEVEREQKHLTERTSRLQFDWTALANDVPVFVTGVLQSTCIEFSKNKNEKVNSKPQESSQISSGGWGTN